MIWCDYNTLIKEIEILKNIMKNTIMVVENTPIKINKGQIRHRIHLLNLCLKRLEEAQRNLNDACVILIREGDCKIIPKQFLFE